MPKGLVQRTEHFEIEEAATSPGGRRTVCRFDPRFELQIQWEKVHAIGEPPT